MTLFRLQMRGMKHGQPIDKIPIWKTLCLENPHYPLVICYIAIENAGSFQFVM